jgi:hypothetical protein
VRTVQIEPLEPIVTKFPTKSWKSFPRPNLTLPSNSVEHDKTRNLGNLKSETNKAKELSFANEEFTIVMLTHRRVEKLFKILKSLDGIPKLNKVIVIWNAPESPNPDLEWPQVNINIKVSMFF